jgi:hypothetical protein
MAHTPSIPTTVAPAGTNYPVLKDKPLIAAAEEYFAKQAEAKVIESRLKELKAQIVAAMHGAPTAYAGVRVLSLTEFAPVPPIPERTIDRTMIGQTIPGKPGRVGYVQLRVQ